MPTKTRRWLMLSGLSLLAFILALAVIEGLSSLSLLTYDVLFRSNPGLASREHLQRDTLVGWVNIPNLRIPEFFGPRAGLATNAQFLRAARNYAQTTPAGKIRVICSGDSFTFGIGVDDRDTWCAQLGELDPRLETVNFGHAGWGIDQAYLFYAREGPKLEHSIHVFALIADDFRRMRLHEYVGYPKPVIRMRGKELSVTGVPVPEPSRLRVWWTYNVDRINQLAFLQFGNRLMLRVRGESKPSNVTTTPIEARTVMLRIFEEMQQAAARNGSSLVIALLEENRKSTEFEAELQTFLATELSRRGIRFVDLWSEFNRLPAVQLDSMFTPRWLHYSRQGNRLVAEQVYRSLRELPQLRGDSVAPAN
jgi:hypothetical protein